MPHSTLVSVAELARHLDDPQWIVFDCSHDLMKPAFGRESYARGHIPGAIFLSNDDDLAGPKNGRNGRHPLPTADGFAAKLSGLGFDGTQQVVAYDGQGGMPSSRLWWMLRWLGHDAVALLDGGLGAWTAAGQPVTQQTPPKRPIARFVPALRPGTLVSAGYVQSQLGSREIAVLDARAADRYRGENEVIDPVAGHIPGALNRFWGLNLQDGKFKPAEALRKEFQALLGARAPAQIVHSCGSGVSACHNLLAMEIAGLGGGRLYGGSWSEWIADPSRPIATGPDP